MKIIKENFMVTMPEWIRLHERQIYYKNVIVQIVRIQAPPQSYLTKRVSHLVSQLRAMNLNSIWELFICTNKLNKSSLVHSHRHTKSVLLIFG